MTVELGTLAPPIGLPLEHRPRVLAFADRWDADLEHRVLARLADLVAEIVIAHEDGAWSFARDRAPRFAGEAAPLRARYRVCGEALFVIDARGILRFVHHGAIAALGEALAVTSEAVEERRRHDLLERVQRTAREWTTRCLVVACELTFHSAPRPRGFARGTGSVCTWRAATGAPPQQPSPIGEPPSPLSPRRAS